MVSTVYVENPEHKKKVEAAIKEITKGRRPKWFEFEELTRNRSLKLSEHEIGEQLKILCRDYYLKVEGLQYHIMR